MKTPLILIADDQIDFIDQLESRLSLMPCKAVFKRANNGYEAITEAAKHQPHFIILHWEMPDFDGLETLQQLKKCDKTKAIPVILIASNPTAQRIQRAYSEGAIQILSKKCRIEELQARIQHTIQKQWSFQEMCNAMQSKDVEIEKLKQIVQNLLPAQVVNELNENKSTAPKKYRNTSVLIAELSNFESLSTTMSPKKTLTQLSLLFEKFDQIASLYRCPRVKTNGNTYTAAAGIWEETQNPTLNAAMTAENMRAYVVEHNEKYKTQWEIKFALSTGDILAGSLSKNNLTFDLFGACASEAERILYYNTPMQIALSESAYQNIKETYSVITKIPPKEKKHPLKIYLLHRRLNEYSHKSKHSA